MKIRTRQLGLAFILSCASTLVASMAAAEGRANPQADAPPDHHGSVFIDPLGFLLFGPTLGAEFGNGKISGTVYGRWFNEGLLARSLFLNGSQNESFDFSYGAGLRGRYYFWGGLSGPHLGAEAEYLHTRVDDPVDLIATNSSYVVPAVEGGYRYAFRWFYVGGAAAIGYAFRLDTSVDNLPGGHNAGSFQVVNESKFYGSASLDLGVYF